MTQTPTDVLICFVLDQSSSMNDVLQPTIDGFNQFLHGQQEVEEGNAYLSLTVFSSGFEARFVGTDVQDVPDLGTEENPYRPSGMTALLDAVGASIKGAEKWVTEHNF